MALPMLRARLKFQSHRVASITSWVSYSVSYEASRFDVQRAGNRNQIYDADLPSNGGLGKSCVTNVIT